jgi:hypothetical protein
LSAFPRPAYGQVLMAGRSGLTLAAVAAFGMLGAACKETALPGTMLGTYAVSGQLQANSCGLGAPDPWQFDVQISQDGVLLYWSWMDGTPPLSAPLSGTMVTLLANQQANVDGVDGGLGPCNLERDDNLQITLGSGSPPTTFTGTISYSFSAAAGSDCGDQLLSAGGQYASLPCTVIYTASANRQ